MAWRYLVGCSKNLVREFLKFWFFGSENALCAVQNTHFGHFWTTHNAILDPKNQNFENSRIRFLVRPTRMLHTKNQLPSTYTAQIKWGGSFFTLKFGNPFLAKIAIFRPILGHFFEKCDIWGLFLWFLVIYSIKVTY